MSNVKVVRNPVVVMVRANWNIGPQTEYPLKKLIRIWRALHEYVSFVHDPEKQYMSLSEWSSTGVDTADRILDIHMCPS